jgi:hypothetical protein
VEGRDRGLDLVLAPAVFGERGLEDADPFGDLGAVPPAAVLPVQRNDRTGVVGACGTTGMVQEHEREQPGNLGLVGLARQQPGQADCLGGQVDAAGVAFVEDQVQDPEYDRDVGGLCERLSGQGLLGPADPLRHRCLRNQEGVGDLLRRQTADRPQGERDCRRRAQRRVAAQKQQQGVVGLLPRARFTLLCRCLLAASPSRVGTMRVDELAHCHRDPPRSRILGRLLGPGAVCLQQRLLQGVLGCREVVSATDEDTEHLRRQDA